jgi:glycosyltransferase involved in cell wall biosynthesis
VSVCLVTREFPPAPGGGVGSYTQNIADAMVRAGRRVVVLTEWVPNAPREEKLGTLRVVRLPFRDHRKPGLVLHPEIARRADFRHLLRFRDPMRVFSLLVRDRLPELIEREAIDVVEAPEYEAPLLDFQQGRVLNSAWPNVPCLIHLHSASRDLHEHDHDDLWSRFFLHRDQNERLSVALADGLVSPSRFLARRTEERMGLPEGTVRVIPLPIRANGAAPSNPPDRSYPSDPSDQTHRVARDPFRVLFVGRLQRLKGVDLLRRAALALRPEFPDLRVRLIGGDCHWPVLGRNWLESLPAAERAGAGPHALFEYLPPRDRSALGAEYAAAGLVCVPSRFENFPNVCVEAMAAGAPVLAANAGGLPEIVEDGRTGFLFDPDSAEGLAARLRDCLRLGAEERRRVGEAGRARVLELCDPEANLARRAELWSELAQRGPREPRIPDFLPGASRAGSAAVPPRSAGSVSVVIPCRNLGDFVEEAVESVRAQSRPPLEIVVVDDGSDDAKTRRVLDRIAASGRARLIRVENRGLVAARNLGAAQSAGDYLVFLDADDILLPDFFEKAAGVLDRHPRAGAVTPWVERFGAESSVWAPPHGEFPFLLAENTMAAASMTRRAAFDEVGGFCPDFPYNYEDWDFWISIAEKGWALIALPEILMRYRVRPGSMLRGLTPAAHSFLRGAMRRRHPDLFRRFGGDVMQIVEQRYRGWPQDYAILQEENDALRRGALLRRVLRRVRNAFRLPF